MGAPTAVPNEQLALLREVVGPGPSGEVLKAAWQRAFGDIAAAANIVLDEKARLSHAPTQRGIRQPGLSFSGQSRHRSQLTINLDDDLCTGSSSSSSAVCKLPPAKRAKLAESFQKETEVLRSTSQEKVQLVPQRSAATVECDWTFLVSSLHVQGFATNRVQVGHVFQAADGSRLQLQAGTRLELRWNLSAKRLKGRPGSADAPSSHEGGTIRFDICGQEVGKFPANTARVLVPLLARRIISLQAVVGAVPPSQLELGTSVPIVLHVSLRGSALQLRDSHHGLRSGMATRVDSTFAGGPAKARGYKALAKEEADHETLRTATEQFLSLMGLPLRNSGTTAEPDSEETGTGGTSVNLATKEDEEGNGDVSDAPEEMSHEASVQLGGRAMLERPNLPRVVLPESIFLAKLRPYQAQAVFWMWQRENPNSKLPAGWVEGPECQEGSAADIELVKDAPTEVPAGAIAERRQLHPMWDEYQLQAPAPLLPGRSGASSEYLYHHRSSGALSLDFPDAVGAQCRGGVLADDMGLGKTVMCLAVASLDAAEVPNVSSTATCELTDAERSNIGGLLVVAPVSLILQWGSEIEKHFPSHRRPTVHAYHGAGRRCSVEQLRTFGAVLTTYGTLSSEQEAGPLFQINWRRIILDEAHGIKNRCSRVAQAAYRLRALSRWCVTGTPLQNSIDELFSLAKFLRIDPWSNWAAWRKAVSAPLDRGRQGNEESMQQALDSARRIVQPLLLRRTKSTRSPLTGELLLTLPQKHVHLIELQLSPPERDFYNALFAKAKAKFDTFVAKGETLAMFTHVFALLLRLRQALCHPFLVFARNEPADTDLQGVEQRCLREMVGTKVESGGLSESFVTGLLDDLRKGNLPDCPICCDPPEDPAMTPCGHVFCRECALKASTKWAGECPICRRAGALDKKALKVLPGASRFPSRLLTKLSTTGSGPAEQSQSNAAYSTKMRELMWRVQADVSSGHRVVVFSQWTSFLDLISPALDAAGIPTRRFDGSLSLEERGCRVAWLMEDAPKATSGRVFLCSLRAGGTGLNLVAASRLYLLDLWWNPAVEEQAIQRVHRIGQTSEVHVFRFVVQDSIDEDLLELQRAKSQLLENALQDGSRREAASKLTLEDLKRLFRPCRTMKNPRRNALSSDCDGVRDADTSTVTPHPMGTSDNLPVPTASAVVAVGPALALEPMARVTPLTSMEDMSVDAGLCDKDVPSTSGLNTAAASCPAVTAIAMPLTDAHSFNGTAATALTGLEDELNAFLDAADSNGQVGTANQGSSTQCESPCRQPEQCSAWQPPESRPVTVCNTLEAPACWAAMPTDEF